LDRVAWHNVKERNKIFSKKRVFQQRGPYLCPTRRRKSVIYLEKGQTILEDAIDLRLRSDVPLGIFLSGGLDSSAVVGLLASRVSKPLKTFSVAYDLGKEFNETPWARGSADGGKRLSIYVGPPGEAWQISR